MKPKHKFKIGDVCHINGNVYGTLEDGKPNLLFGECKVIAIGKITALVRLLNCNGRQLIGDEASVPFASLRLANTGATP